MPAVYWFWIVYLIIVVGCIFSLWPFPSEGRKTSGMVIAILILIGLLGWIIAGNPIK